MLTIVIITVVLLGLRRHLRRALLGRTPSSNPTAEESGRLPAKAKEATR